MKRRKSYSFVHSIFFSSRYMESAYSASLSLFTWLCLLLQHIYLQRVEQMLHTLVVVVKSGSVYYNMSNVVSNIILFHTESLHCIVTTQIFHFLLSLLIHPNFFPSSPKFLLDIGPQAKNVCVLKT